MNDWAPTGKRRWARAAATAVCLLLGLTSCVTPPRIAGDAALDAPAPRDARVTAGRLANGLHYLIQPGEAGGAEVRLVIEAGSLDERDDEAGFAHFIEHMAFRQTARYPDGRIIEFLRGLGANFGQHVNAITAYDRTVYWLSLPRGKTAALPQALQIVADWAGGIVFDDALVQIERGVVLAEKRGREQQRDQNDAVSRALYDQPLYRRGVIGTEASLRSADAAGLRAFRDRNYVPQRMTVIVTGQLAQGVEHWRGLIEREFGAIAAAPQAPPPQRPPFRIAPRTRVVAVEKGSTHAVAIAALYRGRYGDSLADVRDDLRQRLCLTILNWRMQALARRDPDAVSAAVVEGAPSADSRLIEFVLALAEPVHTRAVSTLADAIGDLRADPPRAEELARAREAILAAARRAVVEHDRQPPSALGQRLASHAQRGGYLMSPEQALSVLQTLLPQIDGPELVRALDARLASRDFLITLISPTGLGKPAFDEALLTRRFDTQIAAALTGPTVARAGSGPTPGPDPDPGAGAGAGAGGSATREAPADRTANGPANRPANGSANGSANPSARPMAGEAANGSTASGAANAPGNANTPGNAGTAGVAHAPGAANAPAVRGTGGRSDSSGQPPASAVDPVLMSRPASPGQLIEERSIAELSATRMTLSNGLTVWIARVLDNNDQISIRMSRRGGFWSLPASLIGAGRLARNGVLTEAGIGPLDADQLARLYSGRSARFSIFLGNERHGLSAGATRDSTELVLQTLHQFVVAPRLEQRVLAKNIAFARQRAQADRTDPGEQFELDWVRSLRGTSPHLEATAVPDLEQVDLAQMRQVHRLFYGDVTGMQVVITGNVELDRIRPLVLDYLATLPGRAAPNAPDPALAIRAEALPPVRGSVRIERATNPAQRALLRVRFHNAAIERSAANSAMNAHLRRALNERIREHLRARLGLIYSPSVSIDFRDSDEPGVSVTLQATVDPENLARVEQELQQIVRGLIEQPVSPQELSALLAAEQDWQAQFGRSSAVTGALLTEIALNRIDPPQFVRARADALKLTAEQLQQAFARVFKDQQASIGIYRPAADKLALARFTRAR